MNKSILTDDDMAEYTFALSTVASTFQRSEVSLT